MSRQPHFAAAPSWAAAAEMLTFQPLQPSYTAGRELQSLQVFVRDHKMRELRVADRTLEAHYGTFVLSQSRRDAREASRLALTVSYGPVAQDAQIRGHAARVYEPGPEPPPDDIDGSSPAVVTWADGEMFYLIASSQMPAEALIRIAMSVYGKAT